MEQTPREYAENLVNELYMVDDPMGNYPMCFDNAKQCAAISIKRMIELLSFDLGHDATARAYCQYFETALKELETL